VNLASHFFIIPIKKVAQQLSSETDIGTSSLAFPSAALGRGFNIAKRIIILVLKYKSLAYNSITYSVDLPYKVTEKWQKSL
jgi:hypothetical protein